MNLNKVYVVCEEYRYDYQVDSFIQVFGTMEKAKKCWEEIIEREKMQTWVGDFMDNYTDADGFVEQEECLFSVSDYDSGNYTMISISEQEVK